MCVERGGLSLLALTLVVVAGCSTGGGTALQSSTLPSLTVPDANRQQCRQANATCIKHVVIIIQENRSFNNLFRKFPGASTKTVGMAGSSPVQLIPVTFEEGKHDISHCWQDGIAA